MTLFQEKLNHFGKPSRGFVLRIGENKMLVEILQLVSVVMAGIITGGAWAYNLEIHPALTKARPSSSLDVFTPMFNHANRTQPLLGSIVAIIALVISLKTGNWLWLVAALIMQTIAPYTIFVLMPLNRRLMAKDADPDSPALQADLKRWGGLHFVSLCEINGTIFCEINGTHLAIAVLYTYRNISASKVSIEGRLGNIEMIAYFCNRVILFFVKTFC